MKWHPPSEGVQFLLVAPVVVPLGLLAAAVILPLVPIFMLESWLSRKLRPSPEWHQWFAWRPVRVGDQFDHDRRWVWLEPVERRSRPYNWPTEYRIQGSNNA
jgi:hypothetical protein